MQFSGMWGMIDIKVEESGVEWFKVVDKSNALRKPNAM